jgi:predicted RNA binding protein YcfA (HicA-like mRNA interferase family)
MKYSELLKKLTKDGWYLDRTKKHQIYRHPVKKGVVIMPNHAGQEVPPGTLNSILKQSGLK